MCRVGSNPERASQVASFDTVGESFSAVGTQNPDYTRILREAWFSQGQDYNYTENSCTTAGACAFYLQVCVVCQ